MVATLTVGTITGKERKVADLMEQSEVDILCIQETRWKEEKQDAQVEDTKCGTVEAETKAIVWELYRKRSMWTR